MAIDNRLQIFDENDNPVDYDIMATDVKFADGKDLPTKLDELENEIGESQGGYTPPPGGIPKTDLAQSVQDTLDDVANKVDKVTGKGLSSNDYTTSEKQKLAGLQNYDDTALSAAITSLQNALNALVNGGSVTDAIDTFNEVKAFLNGIDTDDPTLFNQLKSLSDAITALNTALAGKVNTSTTVNGKPLSGNVTIGMSDIQGLLEALANAGGESVVINSDGANIVDSHSNPSILVAPSARQMYMAYLNINKLFNKVNDLYDKLAGIAFKDGKPANWKENANWLTPAIPTHTITLGTMSNVSASMNGTAISGSVTATEGEVTIKLTPSQGAMVLTENITVKMGTENVPFTTAADNGSILVTFILAGDVTFSASASSGRGISFTGTGCTIDDAGVPIGEDLDTTIRADEHFTLPASITVKIGNVDVTHTYTKAQDGKTATLHIDAANITGDLTIICSADEDAHVMLSVSGSGYTISDGNKTYSNGDKVYNTAQVTLSIAPASGKKFTTLPTADKGAMTNNGAYAASSLLIGTSVSDTVSISAVTADLTNYSVGFQSIANFSVAYTDLSGNAIAAVNNVATVVENSGVKIRITPAPDHTLTIGGMTIGGSSVTPSVTTDNGVTVITIEHVTGAVVVSATANEAGAVEITTTANKATVTDNGAKEGQTLVLTIAPSSGYGFKAAEDANDVNRGVILVKDGNNNVIVDTVNGIGLDKVTYGAIAPGSLSSSNKYWSTPTASNTIITISNAPASVTVNVSSAIMFKENGYVDYAENKMVRPWSYHLARFYGKLPCVACANVQNEGNMVSTSKISWNNPNLAQVVYMSARTACMISYDNSDARVEYFNANAGLKVISASANANYLNIVKWRMLFCAGIDSNGKRYLESSYLYHHPSGNTANDGDKNVIFDGADKSSWIFIPDTESPKVVFDGIPEGITPNRVEAADNYTQSCKKIDGYYTEWGNPNGSITITITGVTNVTCNDSNVSITESNDTFSIVVSNLATGEVRNVNLNVTV